MNDEVRIPQSDLSSASMEERGSAVTNASPDRVKMAKKLVKLISSQSNPLTISIDGEWGSGKTFFLDILQEQLREKEFECIYFNAWKDDSLKKDPLVAIIGQLHGTFSKKEGYIDIMKRVGKNIFTQVVVDTAGKYTGLDIEKAISQSSESILEEYTSQANSRDNLKKSLKEIAGKVKDETKHPLVFIIDELDRCRPTFAIELLERVKHIFDINNVVFVFGINRGQLEKTVESIYGNLNSEDYLNRFFDLEYSLPQIEKRAFVEYLLKKHGIFDRFNDLKSDAHQHFNKIVYKENVDWADFFPSYVMLLLCSVNYSLRDMKKALSPIIWSIHNTENKIYSGLVLFFMALRLNNKNRYNDFINGTCTAGEIINHLAQNADNFHKIDSDIDQINMLKGLEMLEAWLYQIDIVEGGASKSLEDIIHFSPENMKVGEKYDNLSEHVKSDNNRARRVHAHAVKVRYYLEDKKIVPIGLRKHADGSSPMFPFNFEGIPLQSIVEMIGSIEVDKRDGEGG